MFCSNPPSHSLPPPPSALLYSALPSTAPARYILHFPCVNSCGCVRAHSHTSSILFAVVLLLLGVCVQTHFFLSLSLLPSFRHQATQIQGDIFLRRIPLKNPVFKVSLQESIELRRQLIANDSSSQNTPPLPPLVMHPTNELSCTVRDAQELYESDRHFSLSLDAFLDLERKEEEAERVLDEAEHNANPGTEGVRLCVCASVYCVCVCVCLCVCVCVCVMCVCVLCCVCVLFVFYLCLCVFGVFGALECVV
jgi:hypothetical protein